MAAANGPEARPDCRILLTRALFAATIGTMALAAAPAFAADGTTVGEVIVTGQKPNPAAQLRAAAAAGRNSEVESLLLQGVPVDGADASGETALMAAARADQPGAVAILRLHRASLDRRNKAGETARTLAAAAADPTLDRALGLKP